MKDQLEALVAQMHESGIFYEEAKREFNKRFIMRVLECNRGNQCHAARELQMHRNTLSRTIAELKLDIRQFRGGRKHHPPRAEPINTFVTQAGDPQFEGKHLAPYVQSRKGYICECGFSNQDVVAAVAHERIHPVAESLAKMGPDKIGEVLKRAAKAGA